MVNKRTERLEKLLVLAKASPTVSKKYEHLVCVGGLTEANEWRRIYPVPWKFFFGGGFKKKSWIEYGRIRTCMKLKKATSPLKGNRSCI